MYEPEVGRITRRQRALIQRSQARTAGLSDRQVDRLVASGEWIRMGRGLYRLASVAMTWEQRALAACLLAGDGAVLSHRSAGALHGLDGIAKARIEVSVPAGSGHRNPIAGVHQVRHLPKRDVRRVDGIPTTSVARTIADIAGQLVQPRLDDVVDDSCCRKLVTPDDLRAAAARASEARGRAGQARLGKSLEVWTPGPLPGSPAEMRLARRIVAAGHPLPERQYEIRDPSGRVVGRVDHAYPDDLLALEYHGLDGHGPRDALADRARENDIVGLGWTLLVATAADLRPGPSSFLNALAARRGSGRNPPSGWRAA